MIKNPHSADTKEDLTNHGEPPNPYDTSSFKAKCRRCHTVCSKPQARQFTPSLTRSFSMDARASYEYECQECGLSFFLYSEEQILESRYLAQEAMFSGGNERSTSRDNTCLSTRTEGYPCVSTRTCENEQY